MISKLLDTIVAISTSKGSSAVGIVRISGSNSLDIATKVSKKNLKPNFVQYSSFFLKDNIILDFGIILFFKKPKSFTGENLVEFHLHGNDLILESFINRIIELGARLAEPGEFSLRAFLNGKIDLLQAEAINSLINSKSIFYNNFILKSLSGKFSKEIKLILDKVLNLRQIVEGSIEFPEDLFFSNKLYLEKFSEIRLLFNNLFEKLYINYFISDNLKIVIAGNTNVGKSSFFNLLLKNNRAIVSDIPGTTRDFIESEYFIDKFNLKLVDTAGFNFNSNSFLEKLSIEKTFEQISESFIIVYIFDVRHISDPFDCPVFNNLYNLYGKKLKFFVLKNKIDLLSLDSKVIYHEKFTEIFLSVKENLGINLFYNEIKNIIYEAKDKVYMVNKRHYGLFLKVNECFSNIDNLSENFFSLDVFAENLKISYKFFLEILGKNTTDDIIKEIFSNFCLGK